MTSPYRTPADKEPEAAVKTHHYRRKLSPRESARAVAHVQRLIELDARLLMKREARKAARKAKTPV